MSKVVYIVSPGHSGSTLLDMIIGSIPGVFSLGEVTYLPWQLDLRKKSEASIENQNICSCLKKFDECEVFTKVFERLNEKTGFDIYKEPYRFNLSILRSQLQGERLTLTTRIASYTLCRSLNWPVLFDVILKLCKLRFINIVKNNWLLFDTIGEVCDVDYIVDSSKDYNRLMFLQSYRPDDVYLVVLIKRDVFGFAHSFLKRGIDPTSKFRNRRKDYIHIKKIIQNNEGLKHLLVEYEKLCENPVMQRKRIANFLNLEDPGKDFKINTQDYHIISGNPMRYGGNIEICLDEKWKKQLTSLQKEQVTELATKYEICL